MMHKINLRNKITLEFVKCGKMEIEPDIWYGDQKFHVRDIVCDIR